MAPSLQVLFDPHCSVLPNVSSANPGKRIKFVQSDVLDTYRDQFEPYVAFGCDMRSHYSGTLFRFPLRSPSLADQSRISKQVGEPLSGFLATSRVCTLHPLPSCRWPPPPGQQQQPLGCASPTCTGSAAFVSLRCAQHLLLQAADS